MDEPVVTTNTTNNTDSNNLLDIYNSSDNT